MDSEQALKQLYEATGLGHLSPVWAKLEILLGLLAAALGVVLAASGNSGLTLGDLVVRWALSVALIMLGAYLALAGHRSHIYQSQNRLTAYLAQLLSDTRNSRTEHLPQ